MSKLFLAMSCFQSRAQDNAFENLMELEPDGLQLTPGNWPSVGFKEKVKNINTRFHHGFCWDKYKRDVYDNQGNPINIIGNWSIHPPKNHLFDFKKWIDNVGDYIFEVMYPGYLLGSGEEIEYAIKLNKRLAVDISHLYIIKCKNRIYNDVLNKLLNYDNIVEIHISQNDGNYDQHKIINKNTPFLDWVKDRNLPIVYEAYLHKISLDDRKKQIDLVRKYIQ